MKEATKYFYAPAITPQWFLVDAAGKTAGRLASKLALLLSGKHLPTYTPNVTPPVFVIVTNAAEIKFGGANKLAGRIYYRHSGRPGGLKKRTLGERVTKDPAKLFTDLVAQMLPKNKLHSEKLAHLKVFAGSEHPYKTQKPKVISF